MKVIVTAGLRPNNWKVIRDRNKENYIRNFCAELVLLNWDSGKVMRRITYQSPAESRNPSMMFKGGEVYGNKLNVVTNSEVITYDLKSWQIERTLTHKTFNDLHGVMQEGDIMWVVNTGLEMVQKVDINKGILEDFNACETSTWHRFDPQCDYRKVGSTKPHEIHINHIFKADGDYFITRMIKQDAIGLFDPSKKFDIAMGNPHDGIYHKGKIFFTTTNGNLVIFSLETRQLITTINLNEAFLNAGLRPDGWCRGVMPFGENRALIGYSQLRHTKFKEFVSWVKNIGHKPAPTRIVEIDIETKEVIKEVPYPSTYGAAIFSVLRYPDDI